ncbi:MAG: D-2-hydroxyacid dehydrogenase [Lachnospiraceae bacterium]|jgi:glycerate dehydrogenase|nr:D-2-hydroxyacid dehydrogenase [Lachnospiraceae bacterium]
MKIVILERNSVGTDVEVSCFEKFGEVICYDNTVERQVAERIGDADIIIGNKAPLNESTLKDAANVKLICLFSTGYDCVDIDYCRGRNIKVANVVDYCTDAVSQHTFAMLFYLLEHLRHYDDYVKNGTYGAQDRFSNFDLPFVELKDKIWGIVGMGHIGRKVAGIAQAFGCHVIFYSASGKSSCTEYERVDLDTLLRTSDFLSLHCPLSERTRGLIDKNALQKMKQTAILLNVARGPVINNADLYWALQNEEIKAAGLDVLEKEPIGSDNLLGRIQDSNRLLITPHMAWAATEARIRIVEEVFQNIEAYLNGKDRNIVNR